MRNINSILFLCIAFVLFACNHPQNLNEVESKYAVNDGIKIHYKTFGSGGGCIVFVHGFGCDMNSWQEQFGYFSDKAKMIYIDLPGYGKSDKPGTEYTLNLFADAVKNVLAAENISSAVLVGHSLGTPVCRQVAFKYPQLVSKIVDVDGVYCFYPADSATTAVYNAFAESFNVDSLRSVIKCFAELLFTPQTPSSVKDYALSVMPGTPKYIAYSTMKNLIEEKYWTQGKINIPTLVLASKNSEIPPDYKQIMSKLYTKMEYCELDSIGHFIMMEQPAMFNEMVEKFIRQ